MVKNANAVSGSDCLHVRNDAAALVPARHKSANCSTWPPSSTVRHAVMGPITCRSTRAELTGMRLSKSFAVAAEYVRHLQSRTRNARSAGWNDLQSQPVKRTRGLAVRFGGNLGARAVLCRLASPSNTWMTRMSAPFSRRWFAKLCP